MGANDNPADENPGFWVHNPQEAAALLEAHAAAHPMREVKIDDRLTIVRMTGQAGLFGQMRPFLGNPSIEAELDASLADSIGKTWWIAYRLSSFSRTLVGWCAERPANPDLPATDPGNESTFESLYVRPDWRGNSIGRHLFTVRFDECRDLPIRAWCSTASQPLYLEHGFTVVREGRSPRGYQWFEVTWTPRSPVV